MKEEKNRKEKRKSESKTEEDEGRTCVCVRRENRQIKSEGKKDGEREGVGFWTNRRPIPLKLKNVNFIK